MILCYVWNRCYEGTLGQLSFLLESLTYTEEDTFNSSLSETWVRWELKEDCSKWESAGCTSCQHWSGVTCTEQGRPNAEANMACMSGKLRCVTSDWYVALAPRTVHGLIQLCISCHGRTQYRESSGFRRFDEVRFLCAATDLRTCATTIHFMHRWQIQSVPCTNLLLKWYSNCRKTTNEHNVFSPFCETLCYVSEVDVTVSQR